VEEVAKLPAIKERMKKPQEMVRAREDAKKMIEKIKDNIEETDRALKNLEGVAKSADEKKVHQVAVWTRIWTVKFGNTTIHAEFDCNRRWAAHYEKLVGLMTADMKRSTREKKYSAIVCSLCSGGLLECPGCGGNRTCGAQVLSDEKCKDGFFHATISRLCPACAGTSECLFCDGQGKILCPVEHRLLAK